MNSDLPISNLQAIPNSQLLAEVAVQVEKAPSSWARHLRQYLCLAALAAASYFVISNYVLQSVTVVGSSMIPTLHDSDHYLLNRWIFHVRAPHRGDIVVLRDPTDSGFSVKRIVALAGDSVCLKEGVVFVNGSKIVEPYLRPGTPTFCAVPLKEQSFRCASDQYLVLGDNRNASVDSRAYGPVPRENILGLIIR